MSIGLPEGISTDDEIQIEWDNSDIGTMVVASLGDASITIQTTHEAAPVVPWLVASLPTILEAAWAAIEAEDKEEEPASE